MIRAFIFCSSNACDSHRRYYGEFASAEEAEASFREDYPETTQYDEEYYWEYSLELQQ